METDWREEAQAVVRRICDLNNALEILKEMNKDPSVMVAARELVELRRVFCLGMAGDQEED